MAGCHPHTESHRDIYCDEHKRPLLLLVQTTARVAACHEWFQCWFLVLFRSWSCRMDWQSVVSLLPSGYFALHLSPIPSFFVNFVFVFSFIWGPLPVSRWRVRPTLCCNGHRCIVQFSHSHTSAFYSFAFILKSIYFLVVVRSMDKRCELWNNELNILGI